MLKNDSVNPNQDLIEKVLKYFSVMFILIGSLITLIYYTFYVGKLPDVGGNNQLGVFLGIIAMLCIFIFFIVFIGFIAIVPSLLLITDIDNRHKTKEINAVYFIAFVCLSIFFGIEILTHGKYAEYTLISLIIFDFIFNWIYFKIKKQNKYTIFSFIVSSISYIIFAILFLSFLNDSKLNILLNFFYAIMIFAILAALNIFVVANFFNQESLKNRVRNVMVGIIGLIFILSMIMSNIGKENPFVVKPFEILKLGHYKETLYFKKDFIKLYPELLEDTNMTSNKFCILSNLGSQYIAQKIYLDKDKHEKCDINNTYSIDKSNLAGLGKISKMIRSN